MKASIKTGTREWSDVSHNIGQGCSHGCLYCYAAAHALKTGQIKRRDEWVNEKLTLRRIPTKPGIIMFPTAHDITSYYLDEALKAIRQIILTGRELLIVTKANLECMKAICTEIKKHKGYYDKVLIRVTIGSMNETICKFWEPGAPLPEERLEALKYAFLQTIRTSVSVEPMLSGILDAADVFRETEPWISDDIWFGKMNNLKERLFCPADVRDKVLKVIQEMQSDEEIMMLYHALKNDRKVKWKDSIQSVVSKNQK